MHIFIDETGNFVIQDVSTPKVSSLVSLTIPDEYLKLVNKEFSSLKNTWGFKGEVKGSKLNEQQISDVISLLRNHNVLVEILCLDIATHSKEGVDNYKRIQAEKITEILTDEHNENMVTKIYSYRDRLIGLPNQLFLQAMTTIRLIERILTNSTLYYSQCMPRELGTFNWVVDAKDSNVSKTNYEELWSALLMPSLQNNFSLGLFKGGDYSYFLKYKADIENMTDFQKNLRSKNSIGAIDVKKIINENLSFEDSASIVGLQLVDIIASAFNRAMNGNLKLKGWRYLGTLMCQEPSMQLYNLSNEKNIKMNQMHMSVILNLKDNKKPMILT